MRTSRGLLVSVALGFTLSALAGCQSGPKRGTANVVRTPAYQPDSLGTVAFLGLARGSAAAEDAPREMEPLLTAQLAAAALPFTLISREEVERRLATPEDVQTLGAVLTFWNDDKKVDRFELMKLGERTGVGGFLLGVVDEWSQTQATSGGGNAAMTRVGVSLTLYSAATGRSVWRADAAETLEATATLGGVEIGSESNTAMNRQRQQHGATVRGLERGANAPEFVEAGGLVAAALVQALAAAE
jgi:hypothetical protein